MVGVTIDGDRCQGHGRCALIAASVFDIDDSGQGLVLVDPVPDAAASAVREAVLSCPESAIQFTEQTRHQGCR